MQTEIVLRSGDGSGLTQLSPKKRLVAGFAILMANLRLLEDSLPSIPSAKL